MLAELEKVYLQKLKILLQSRLFLLFLFVLFSIRFCSVVLISRESTYQIDDTSFLGIVQDYVWKDGKIQLEIQTGKEILSGISREEIENLDMGLHDTVMVYGTLKELTGATNFYAFNYQEYAKRHSQYYSVDIDKIEIVQKNKNVFYESVNKSV